MEISPDLVSLITAAKAGDREAFRVLYELLAPKLFRFIRARARTRDEAMDILQETFIDFWKGLPQFSYQGEVSLEAFLYRIASRKRYRLFRWWKNSISLEAIEDVVLSDEIEEHDQGAILDITRALQMLKSTDREIIVLRHMEGRSFSDIAELLGHSENALKVRHHRAIGRLRNKLHYD